MATPAGVARLVSKINGLTVPASSGTNWDAGLWQIARDNSRYHFQSTFIITDGDPTFYGPTGNGGRGNTTRFTEVENGFSANGRNTGLRFCCAAASALVNSRNVCDPSPDER